MLAREHDDVGPERGHVGITRFLHRAGAGPCPACRSRERNECHRRHPAGDFPVPWQCRSQGGAVRWSARCRDGGCAAASSERSQQERLTRIQASGRRAHVRCCSFAPASRHRLTGHCAGWRGRKLIRLSTPSSASSEPGTQPEHEVAAAQGRRLLDERGMVISQFIGQVGRPDE